MQKIVPHLWFDKEAGEAARLYVSLFQNSSITDTSTLENTPSGSVEILTANLAGRDFMMMSAGPYFKFTPAVSFLVACETKEEVDRLYGALRAAELMPLDSYPFSERYAWVEDKYGVSWQLMHFGGREITQKIMPTLMFVGNVCGKAEEAMHFYASLFADSRVGDILRWEKGEEPDRPGTVKHGGFVLAGGRFAAMDSAYEHDFAFNEAVSLVVNCADQQEIDYFWNQLSAVPDAEQCGWLKDRYGLSWQIVPADMDELMGGKDPAKAARASEAMLQMKKIDIAALKKARDGA